MIVLGINSFFEHPAVALVRDGELLFAMEEERLTGIKHGRKYTPYKTYVPYDVIGAAFRATGLEAEEVNEIAYSYSRWTHLGALWGCFTGARTSSFKEEWAAFRSVSNVAPALRSAYEIPHRYRDLLHRTSFAKTKFTGWDHHLSHAASAFYCSGFDSSLVIVADGSGEVACTSVFLGSKNTLRRIGVFRLPHSLGFFYSRITAHLGFEPFSDEYKVMGLAAYGEPAYVQEMRTIVRLGVQGKYSINPSAMSSLPTLLGKPRAVGDSLTSQHADIARSAQYVLEQTVEHVVSHYMKLTNSDRLCAAGGVFLNCVCNARLANMQGVRDFFVQPASHDAGTALGAAILSGIRAGTPPQLKYSSMFLGTEYGEDAIVAAIEESRFRYMKLSEGTVGPVVARLLQQDKVIGVFRGRMEFGPRALGGRSLIASPMSSSTRDRLNIIKGREEFRPLAPLVTEEAYDTYFEGPENRYMMLAVKAKPLARERAPAVVHADGTSRVQVVRFSEDPFLHTLLNDFNALTGVPVLANTSFNVRGKPIDESPIQALSSFVTTGIDALLMGPYLIER
jgi:carbamoyltransferase